MIGVQRIPGTRIARTRCGMLRRRPRAVDGVVASATRAIRRLWHFLFGAYAWRAFKLVLRTRIRWRRRRPVLGAVELGGWGETLPDGQFVQSRTSGGVGTSGFVDVLIFLKLKDRSLDGLIVIAIMRPIPSWMPDVSQAFQLESHFIYRFATLAALEQTVVQGSVEIGHRSAPEPGVRLQRIVSEFRKQGGINAPVGRFHAAVALIASHCLFRSRSEIAVTRDLPPPVISQVEGHKILLHLEHVLVGVSPCQQQGRHLFCRLRRYVDAIALDPPYHGGDLCFPVPCVTRYRRCRPGIPWVDDRAGAFVVGLPGVNVVIQRVRRYEAAIAHSEYQRLGSNAGFAGASRMFD